MKGLAARPGTGGLRPEFVIAPLAAALVGALWFAGTWSTTGAREADAERFARLSASPGLAALLGWWAGLAAHGIVLALVLGALQLAGCLGTAFLCLRLTRSRTLAAAAGLVTLVSPFPEHWLGRPSGLADGLGALALLAVFAGTTGLGPAARPWSRALAGLLAVALTGWAAAPLLAIVAVARSRAGTALLGAAAAGLALRALAGVPPEALAGRWDLWAPDALPAMRLLVGCAFAAPAAVFVLTRRRVVPFRARLVDERGVLAAAAAIVACAGLLADPWPALFAVQLALTVAAASTAGRIGWAPRLQTSVATAIAMGVLAIGWLVRPNPFPPDDAAAVAAQRDLVRSVGTRFVLVDHGDPMLKARYSPAHLAFLAGHPVEPEYADDAAPGTPGPVLDASPEGLLRIDGLLRTVAALDALRARMRFDVMAASERGVLSSRAPAATPSKLGVVARYPRPGPAGSLESIIVVSGFSTTFAGVEVRPGDRLVYLAAKALDVGNAARATVTVELPGGRVVRAVDDLPPAPHHGSLLWQLRTLAIPGAGPARVTIRFATSSPSGNGTGDWVAFAEPAVVRAR